MRSRRASLPTDRPVIDALLERVADNDGFPALSEEARVALVQGSGLCGWLAGSAQRPDGFAHRRVHRGTVVVEIATAGDAPELAAATLVSAIEADEAGTGLRVWVSRPDAEAAVVDAGGWVARRLVRLQRTLPIGAIPPPPDGVRIVRFREGVDEGAYLIVANDAFGAHPESGAWTRDTFAERAARNWFDPDGLILAWDRGMPVGACWTKVHAGGIGEIYSIAVRPAAAGRGLGRALVLAGFEYLSQQRDITVGMLWADQSNDAAVRLYGRLGMEPVRERTEVLLEV